MKVENAGVLLAHEKGLFLMGVREALVSYEYTVVAETRVAAQIVTLAERNQADVVVLGSEMNGEETLPYIRRLVARRPEVKIAVVAPGPVSAADAMPYLEAGAAAIADAALEPAELAVALQLVLGGERDLVFSSETVHVDADAAGLTHREIEVLQGVGRGLKNDAIARELAVTPNTVKYHLDAIYRKLRVRNRIEAMSWSVKHGLVARPTSSRMRAGVGSSTKAPCNGYSQ
jgi:DNA-binding NarL/FixJ family response regulator